MKRYLMGLMLVVALLLTSCTSRTEYGDCIGAFDAKPNNGLEYKANVNNIVLAGVFFQTVFVPALVVLNETYCPVSKK